MTLIELLVVISIMVILMAISVPNLKPMLDAQQQRNAAQLLAVTLEKARLLAMESNSRFGVTLERYNRGRDDNAYQDACITFFISRISPVARDVIPDNVRGFVTDGGVPVFYRFQVPDGGGVYAWERAPDGEYSLGGGSGNLQLGGRGAYHSENKIFNAFGRTPDHAQYTAPDDWNDVTGTHAWTPSDPLDLTDNDTPPAVFRKMSRQLRPTFAPPSTLPRGTVVDLRWSGTAGRSQYFTNYDCFSRNNSSITILFSPDGYVDRIAFGDDASTSEFPTEPIHLLVGTWDQLSSHGDGREEIRDNYEYVSNFWVSIDPRTGMVSVNEVNPVKIIRDGANTTYDAAAYPNGYVDAQYGDPGNFYQVIRYTRRFANDFQRNYGGF